MSAPTFFPTDVRRALDRLADSVDRDAEDEVFVDAKRLVEELKRWEREWRSGRAKLVPQTLAWEQDSAIHEAIEKAIKGKR